MKKILIPILLLCGLFAKANDLPKMIINTVRENDSISHSFGDKKGDGVFSWWTNLTVNAPTCSVLTAGSLTNGDYVIMNSGNYTTWRIGSGLPSITFTNQGGAVTFSGSNYVDFGNSGSGTNGIKVDGRGTNGVTYGFIFTTSSVGFLFTAPSNQNDSFWNIQGNGLGNNLFDNSGYGQNYVGTTASLKQYKFFARHISMINSGQVWQGFYGTPSQNQNICDNVDIDSVNVSQTATNGTQVAGNMTNCNLHDWSILYTGLNPVTGDVGAMQISGNGKMYNIYLKGGRGYNCRMLLYSLGSTPGNFYFFNNIGLATNAYGLIDVRCDSAVYGSTNPYMTSANAYVMFNAAGNKTDINGYICTLGIVGVMNNGSHCYGKYNYAFNNQYGANPLWNNNSNGTWNASADTLGNYYLSAAQSVVALSDTFSYLALASGSPFRNAATVISPASFDILNQSRGGGTTDVGPHIYAAAILPPTLTPAAGATVGGTFTVTYPSSSAWASALTSITVNGATLSPTAYTVTSTGTTFNPANSSLLQSAPASLAIVFIATGYSNDAVTQSIGVGNPYKLSISTQPTAPLTNPANFNVQPIIKIQDLYSNFISTATNSVTATIGSGSSWSLSGTTTVTASGGIATFTTLGASNTLTVNNSVTIIFTSSGLISATSNSIILAPLNPPGCFCAYHKRGDGIVYAVR